MLEDNLDCFLIDISQIYNIINLRLLVQLFMNDKPGETPKGDHAPYREKIKRILFLTEEVIKKGKAPKIMDRIARIINKPSMNDLARLLSLQMAERAPETLLENEHIIRGQIWTNTMLGITMANMSEESE